MVRTKNVVCHSQQRLGVAHVGSSMPCALIVALM